MHLVSKWRLLSLVCIALCFLSVVRIGNISCSAVIVSIIRLSVSVRAYISVVFIYFLLSPLSLAQLAKLPVLDVNPQSFTQNLNPSVDTGVECDLASSESKNLPLSVKLAQLDDLSSVVKEIRQNGNNYKQKIQIVDARSSRLHRDVYPAASLKYDLESWLSKVSFVQDQGRVLIITDPLREVHALTLIDKVEEQGGGLNTKSSVRVVAGGLSQWAAAELPLHGERGAKRFVHELPSAYFLNHFTAGGTIVVASTEPERDALAKFLGVEVFLLKADDLNSFLSRLIALKQSQPVNVNVVMVGDGYSNRHRLVYANNPLGQVYFVEGGYTGLTQAFHVSRRAGVVKRKPIIMGQCSA